MSYSGPFPKYRPTLEHKIYDRILRAKHSLNLKCEIRLLVFERNLNLN